MAEPIAKGQGHVSSDRPAAPWPQLPGYRVEAELGAGANGVVYRVRQVKLDRVVAVKVLRGATATTRARFLTEAQALARLRHPNIVQVHDYGEHDGSPYLVMELVEGGTLAQALRQSGPLTPIRAASLAALLARAVQHAHAQDILHRDLKPGNVLLEGDGVPKIADFGLAKRLDVDGGQTQQGAVLGTPWYMAPEQAAGRNAAVGPAADVYALGVILYELLTGAPPFRSRDLLELLQQIGSEAPAPPRAARPDVPSELEAICLRCLEKDAVKRFASAGELADALERCARHAADGDAPTADAPRPAAGSRRRWIIAAAGVIVVLLLGLGAIGLSYALRPGLVDVEPDRGADPKVPPVLAAAPAAADDVDRRLALWVLRRGGAVSVSDPPPDYAHDVFALAELPKRSFRLLGVCFRDHHDFGDGDLVALKDVPRLEWIELSGTALTDTGLATLKEISGLNSVTLTKTRISNVGMKHLAELRGLTYLNLSHTNIGDTGLPHLYDLRYLTQISLEGTRVTATGVEALRKALPGGCRIDSDFTKR